VKVKDNHNATKRKEKEFGDTIIRFKGKGYFKNRQDSVHLLAKPTYTGHVLSLVYTLYIVNAEPA
jgi:hypothetical protein